jgi:hypothetical protein
MIISRLAEEKSSSTLPIEGGSQTLRTKAKTYQSKTSSNYTEGIAKPIGGPNYCSHKAFIMGGQLA